MEALIWKLWAICVAIFMAPGKAMIASLAATPWGKEWGVHASPEVIYIFAVSLVFWCLLISLANAADDHIRAFLRRNVAQRTTRRR